jgi:hypothetical protein
MEKQGYSYSVFFSIYILIWTAMTFRRNMRGSTIDIALWNLQHSCLVSRIIIPVNGNSYNVLKNQGTE